MSDLIYSPLRRENSLYIQEEGSIIWPWRESVGMAEHTDLASSSSDQYALGHGMQFTIVWNEILCVGSDSLRCQACVIHTLIRPSRDFKQIIRMETTLVAVEGKGTNPKTTLYVGGLEETVNEASLHAAFIPFGDIKDVNIPLDHASGKHRG